MSVQSGASSAQGEAKMETEHSGSPKVAEEPSDDEDDLESEYGGDAKRDWNEQRQHLIERYGEVRSKNFYLDETPIPALEKQEYEATKERMTREAGERGFSFQRMQIYEHGSLQKAMENLQGHAERLSGFGAAGDLPDEQYATISDADQVIKELTEKESAAVKAMVDAEEQLRKAQHQQATGQLEPSRGWQPWASSVPGRQTTEVLKHNVEWSQIQLHKTKLELAELHRRKMKLINIKNFGSEAAASAQARMQSGKVDLAQLDANEEFIKRAQLRGSDEQYRALCNGEEFYAKMQEDLPAQLQMVKNLHAEFLEGRCDEILEKAPKLSKIFKSCGVNPLWVVTCGCAGAKAKQYDQEIRVLLDILHQTVEYRKSGSLAIAQKIYNQRKESYEMQVLGGDKERIDWKWIQAMVQQDVLVQEYTDLMEEVQRDESACAGCLRSINEKSCPVPESWYKAPREVRQERAMAAQNLLVGDARGVRESAYQRQGEWRERSEAATAAAREQQARNEPSFHPSAQATSAPPLRQTMDTMPWVASFTPTAKQPTLEGIGCVEDEVIWRLRNMGLGSDSLATQRLARQVRDAQGAAANSSSGESRLALLQAALREAREPLKVNFSDQLPPGFNDLPPVQQHLQQSGFSARMEMAKRLGQENVGATASSEGECGEQNVQRIPTSAAEVHLHRDAVARFRQEVLREKNTAEQLSKKVERLQKDVFDRIQTLTPTRKTLFTAGRLTPGMLAMEIYVGMHGGANPADGKQPNGTPIPQGLAEPRNDVTIQANLRAYVTATDLANGKLDAWGKYFDEKTVGPAQKKRQ